MNVDHFTEHIAMVYRALKQATVEKAGGPEDASIVVLLFERDKAPDMFFLETRDDLPAMMVEEARPRGPEAVVFNAEALMRVFPTRDEEEVQREMENYYRGQTHDRFHAGDMTVREALITVAVARDGSVGFRCQPYHYDDAGEVVFEELPNESHSEALSSAVVDEINLAWRQ